MRAAGVLRRAALAATCCAAIGAGHADDRCTVGSPLNGAFPVEIDGKKYLAISRETAAAATECRRSLTDAEQRLAQERQLRENLENVVVPAMRKDIALKDEHIATLDAQVADLKSAKAKLEAMLGLGGFTYEAGVGVNNDGKGAALLGLGYRRWHLWGYAQDGSSGILFGKEF